MGFKLTMKYLKFLGFVPLVSCYIVFLIIFMTAFSTEEKMVEVYINVEGEAVLEFIILTLTFPIVIYCCYEYIMKGWILWT